LKLSRTKKELAGVPTVNIQPEEEEGRVVFTVGLTSKRASTGKSQGKRKIKNQKRKRGRLYADGLKRACRCTGSRSTVNWSHPKN